MDEKKDLNQKQVNKNISPAKLKFQLLTKKKIDKLKDIKTIKF